MTRRISAVASSRASDSARRFSRSRTLAASSLGDLRATGGLAFLDFAGFGPRRMGLPVPLMKRPGTGYGERGLLGKCAEKARCARPIDGVQAPASDRVIAGVGVTIWRASVEQTVRSVFQN